MSAILIPGVMSAPASVTDYNSNLDNLESSFADIGPYISSGLVPTVGTGLSVNVSSGTAVIGAHLAPASFVIGGLTPSTTVHLFLLQNGTGTSNTSGTPPVNSVKLGTAVTGVATVTSVNTLRSSGRQVFVRPENQVPGAVGSMGSINLANWAAAAADNVPVFGVLPAGAVPAPNFSTVPLLAPNSVDRNLIQPTADANHGLVLKNFSATLTGANPFEHRLSDNTVTAHLTPSGSFFALGLAANAVAKTTAYQALTTDFFITVDASGAAGSSITITLPRANALPGQKIHIVKSDTSAKFVNIQPFSGSGDTIQGSGGYNLNVQYQDAWLESDGVSEWFVSNTVLATTAIYTGLPSGGFTVEIDAQDSADTPLTLTAGGSVDLFRAWQFSGGAGIVYRLTSLGEIVLAGPTTVGFQMQGAIRNDFENNVDATFHGRLKLSAFDFNAEREGVRIEADGTNPRIGFLGHAAVVRQTGGAATAAATYGATEQGMLNAAYAALRAYGLLT